MAGTVAVSTDVFFERIAVRCPVCNTPVLGGNPGGHFQVRCPRHACRALLVIHAGASRPLYSSDPTAVQTPEESGPCHR